MILTKINDGDYTKISGVEFGDAGAESFSASVLNVKKASSITLHLDKVDGKVIGKAEFSKDGLATVSLTGAVGKHDVFFVFAGDFEADYWQFEDSKTAIPQGPFCKEKLTDAEAKCDLPVIDATLGGAGNFIDFENYDVGGAGKAYYDMDTENQGGEYREDRVDVVSKEDKCGSGYAVGYTQKGEWLEYTVNVAAEGPLPYELSYATGSESVGVLFFMDNEPITDTLKLEGTGDWDTYTTFKGKTTKKLTKGEHVFKVQMTSDYVNLDWIAFGEVGSESEKDASEKRCEITGIKSKFATAPGIIAKTASDFKVFDVMGNMLGKIRVNAGATVAELKADLKNAGFRNGAYVVKSTAGQALRIDLR
jgi:hypothetical protein